MDPYRMLLITAGRLPPFFSGRDFRLHRFGPMLIDEICGAVRLFVV